MRARRVLGVAASRDVVRGAVTVSLVVGSILNAINQGDRILAGFEGFDVGRGLLNYVVPYVVSTWSATRIALRALAPAPVELDRAA